MMPHAAFRLARGTAIRPTNRIDVTPTSIGTAANAHNIVMPAVVNVGELLIAQIVATEPGSITTPAGWDLEDISEGTASTAPTCAVYTREADGTEGGTTVNWVTANSVQMVGVIHRIEAGTYTSGMISVFSSTGTDANPDPPHLPIPWGDTLNTALALFGSTFNNPPSAYPSGYSEGRGDASSATTGSSAVAQSGSAIKGLITGVSENPGTFTTTGSRNWVSQLVLIAPGGVPAMAAPVFLSHLGQYFSSDTVPHLVTMPATVDAGDLLVVVTTNHSTSTVTTPSGGWVKEDEDALGAVANFCVFRKIAAGTEGGTTVDFATSAAEKMTAYTARIQAGTFNTTTPLELGALNTGVSALPLANAMNPSGGVKDYLFFAVAGADNRRDLTTLLMPGYPGGAMNASGGATSLSTAANVYAAHMPYRSGTSWAAQFTITNAQTWGARTIAVNPL